MYIIGVIAWLLRSLKDKSRYIYMSWQKYATILELRKTYANFARNYLSETGPFLLGHCV